MERHLSITSALVHSRGIAGNELRQKIGAIETGGRAGINDGAGGDQPVGCRARAECSA